MVYSFNLVLSIRSIHWRSLNFYEAGDMLLYSKCIQIIHDFQKDPREKATKARMI